MSSPNPGSPDINAELTVRQRELLSYLVREHIKTSRPVGSKVLSRCCDLDVSPATIRSELAELGRRGYLHQPHTSAGRVPSQKAYRFCVNNLATSQKLPIDKLSWIHSQYRRVEPDLDKILRMSTKLLADIVKHPAVALEPSSEQDRLTDIQTRPVSAHALRIICTRANGQEHEFVVRFTETITADQIEQLGRVMKGELRRELVPGPAKEAGSPAGELTVPADLLRAVHRQLWASSIEGRVYVEGTAYDLDQPEFQELSRLQAVMETLGEQQALRELLWAASADPAVHVTIGAEHATPRLEQCSSVMSSFTTGPSSRPGVLGVVGPMRMQYHEVIPAVDCVAQQIGQVLTVTATG